MYAHRLRMREKLKWYMQHVLLCSQHAHMCILRHVDWPNMSSLATFILCLHVYRKHACIQITENLFSANHASAQNWIKLQMICDIWYVCVYDDVCMCILNRPGMIEGSKCMYLISPFFTHSCFFVQLYVRFVLCWVLHGVYVWNKLHWLKQCTCVHVCMCTCVHVCMCTCVHVCILSC
jgi:hypothetical protein